MTANNLDRHAMILRRENYGGTLFHPHDATFVQLDEDGFECVRRVLGHGQEPADAREAEFIRAVQAELPSPAPVRIVEHLTPQKTHVSAVLSAPILVDFQITERCGLGCPQCYASSIPKGIDVSWEDAVLAVHQMREAGVCQVALGGGEPILHPRLVDLLELIRDHGMVPNMTTTGIGMSDETLSSIRRNCGAVAMSLEGVGERFGIRRKQGFDRFRAVRDRFLEASVPLVFQITVSNENVDELDDIAAFCLETPNLYGVVFLAHKPAGRAIGYDQPLAKRRHPDVHARVLSAVRTLQPQMRVGFDCCFSPAMVGFERELGYSRGTIVEGCSATRSGIGLTPTLDVLPCTFLVDRKLGNLREKSLLEVWRDSHAGRFRQAMQSHAQSHASCRSCPSNASCLGGCSVWSLTGCETKSSEIA